MEIVIDTHALIWYLSADKKLGKKAKQAIEALGKTRSRLIISIVVLMEVLVLIEKGKLKFTWEEFNQQISQFPGVIIYPIGIDVLEEMRRVGKNLELHDRILVATAFLHKAILLSKDEEIMKVKEVRTVW